MQPLAPAHPHPLNLNVPMQDRYGLPITTGSSRAADLFVDGLDILLSMNHGAPERIAQAIEADDSFAVAHATLAYRFMFEGKVEDARKSIKRAAARAEGLTRRERLYVAVIHAYIHSPGHEALSLMKEYLREFPRDILILYIANNLLFYGCSGGGSKSFPADQMALCGEVAPHYDDDWAFQSRYAFAHHESGILDESLRLAEASLKTRPDNADASHSVAHVLFERGEAHDGAQFLDEWTEDYDSRAPFYVHLAWHYALFELSQGHYGKVLDLYDRRIQPAVAAGDGGALADAAALAWRYMLYSNTVPDIDWQALSDLAEPALRTEGTAYRDVHAALALAGANHWDRMTGLLARMQSRAADGDALASEIMVPLLKGLERFAAEKAEEALELLDPLFGPSVLDRLARIGGSHAQREILEDTLVACYIETGRFEQAESMLRTRLSRRPSTRDLFWLAKSEAALGNNDAAQSNFRQANQDWIASNHDPDSAELASLRASIS